VIHVAIQEVRDALQAERYMREELSDGTTLAKYVLKAIDFSAGKFRVAMPETVDQSQPLDYRYESARVGRDDEICFARVMRSFIRDPECAVLMQDTQVSMSSTGFHDLPHSELIVPYGSEVYWSVSGRELSELPDAEMLEIVWSASFWPFSAFFYVDGVSCRDARLGDEDLERIVTTLVGLAVGAFHDHSFLMWWRDDLRPFPTSPRPDD
jgi:hypothetical protein